MLRRDPERLQKLRIAIRYLLREDAMERGAQTRLAEHFRVSRQRVHQVVTQEQHNTRDPQRVAAMGVMRQFSAPARVAVADAPLASQVAADDPVEAILRDPAMRQRLIARLLQEPD